jgi:copper chaperone CopZ
MKRLTFALTLALSTVCLPSLTLAEEVTVTVKGMVCSFCAQGIKKTFKKMPEVTQTLVDLDQKVVKLTVKDGQTLGDKEIEQAINDAGYEVVKIERQGT